MRKSGKKHMADGRTDYSTYRFSPGEWLRTAGEGAGIGLFIVWLCYRSVWALPLLLPVMLVYIRARSRTFSAARRFRMNLHFRDFLASLHTGMAAGYSLENGIRSAARDLEHLYGQEDPLAAELREIIRQMSFQRPAEVLFRDLGRRSQVEDIVSFGEVLMIAKRTGGDMGEILQTAWRNLCEKIDTREEIETVLASRRYEQQVMSLMPAAILLYLRAAFGDFLDPLYGNAAGAAVMTACLLLWAAAWLWGRHLVEHAISQL